MNYFHIIEDACVVLASKGVYRQAKVYRRGQALYAAYGSGFIRLFDKGTSLPNVRVDAIDVPGCVLKRDSAGRFEWVTDD